ncbi:MAG: N-acetylmuramoyl-L-alanine amidase, partial [bacterium]|nr:N-acetylmuramoyl-L-alanine amidase [bacterium]
LSYEYIRESIQMASFIQDGYVKDLGSSVTSSRNRGIKKARFFVLEETFMPAILTEIGFITHREEEKLLRREEHQKKIAESLADSVVEFISWYEANNGFIQ